jgi:hypothetical protein
MFPARHSGWRAAIALLCGFMCVAFVRDDKPVAALGFGVAAALALFCSWRYAPRLAIGFGGALESITLLLRHAPARAAFFALPAAVAIFWPMTPVRWHARTAEFWLRVAVVYVGGIVSIDALLSHDAPYRRPLLVAALFGVPAVIAGLWAWIPTTDRWLVALRAARLWLPVVVWVIAEDAFNGQPRNQDFYNAAAQIIPVLLLALALETRYVRLQGRTGPLEALQAVLLVCVLGYGEWEALRGVAGLPQFEGGDVEATIVAGFTAIAVAAFVGPEDRFAERLSREEPPPDAAD